MSLLTLLEVFISLVFAWLVLSIAAMYIQEWIGARLRLRAVMLEKHIRNFLADPTLADQFYDHPLIQSLHTGDDQANRRRPSYIPAQIFSLALFDILVNAGKPSSILQYAIQKLRPDIKRLQKEERARAEAQFRLVLHAVNKAVAAESGEAAVTNGMERIPTALQQLAQAYARPEHPDEIYAERQRLAEACAALEQLAEAHPTLRPAVEQVFQQVETTSQEVRALLDDLRAERGQANAESKPERSAFEQIREGIAVLGVTNPQLRQALESLLLGIQKGDQALGAARERVEAWFDNGTERLNGWYKRQAQKMSFVIGIGLAIALNADTVTLAQTLWREPLIRQALAAQANAFLEQNQDGVRPMSADELNALQQQFSTLNLPFGWVGTPLSVDENGNITNPDFSNARCTLWPESPKDHYGLKIGRLCYPIINAPAPNDPAGILLKLFGLLASGIAAAQGAPFWFDILKKTINIRTSGANPSEPKG